MELADAAHGITPTRQLRSLDIWRCWRNSVTVGDNIGSFGGYKLPPLGVDELSLRSGA